MASISSLSGSSSANSIYGSRNVISGLASGLDTETLIENAVSGFKSKITALQQQQTLVQWKQDAYRGIIDKMVQLNRKYTSYTSSTNLFSPSFFNKAVTTSVLGKSANAVSAAGRTTSNVKIKSIDQLASAATYRSSAALSPLLKGVAGVLEGDTLTTTGGEMSLDENVTVGALSGGMSIKYGSSSVYVSFDENDVYKDAGELVEGIKEKLGDSLVKTGNGEYVKASERIDVKLENGRITFSDKSSGNNSVYISAADDSLKTSLGIRDTGSNTTGFSADAKLTTKKEVGEYLDGKSLTVSFNGSEKTVSLKGIKDDIAKALEALGKDATKEQKQDAINKAVEKKINEGLEKSFGKNGDKGNVTAEIKDGKLSFAVKKGDTLSVKSDANQVLGLGEDGVTSYLNVNKKLGDFMEFADKLDDQGNVMKDEAGNVLKQPKTLNINGQEFSFDEDTTIEGLINQINGNKEAGVNISYSKLTNQFSITATETGTSGRIDVKGDLAGLFGETKEITDDDGNKTFELVTEGSDKFKAGTDAQLTVEINGEEMKLTRSSNTIDFDGMSVTLKSTLSPDDKDYEEITFESKADSDKIIEAIQTFVDDYNAMVTEVRKQYATVPAEKSTRSHTRYMPLTDEDREGMSESAIAAYEEKAKQGILFGQSELANLHNALRDAVSFAGKTSDSKDVLALDKMGISTEYSGGLTTLTLDVEKLRETLDSDPDSVRDIFTKSTENGAKSDGIMQNLKRVIDTYAGTSTGSQGILVQRAGSQYAPTSLNSNALQTEYDNLTSQIEKWQDKMADRVDYYTSQFTALEQLMSQMNNQSSMLAGLMGGGSY